MIGWVSRLGTGQTYTYRAFHQRFLRKWKVCKIFNFLPCVKQFCVWKFYKGGFAMLCRLPEHNGLGDGAESGGQPGGRQQQLRLPHAGPVRDRENNGAESEAEKIVENQTFCRAPFYFRYCPIRVVCVTFGCKKADFQLENDML